MRRTAALAVMAALAGAGLTACTPISAYSGFQAIDANPKDVKVATDTKSTVRAKLGSPSATSTFDPNVWFYMNQVKQRVAFRRPVVTYRDITAITFNKETEMVETGEHLQPQGRQGDRLQRSRDADPRPRDDHPRTADRHRRPRRPCCPTRTKASRAPGRAIGGRFPPPSWGGWRAKRDGWGRPRSGVSAW
jgi:outer membrane protein assembly factor BamE (lipoprotein component of BamABCDE complex)